MSEDKVPNHEETIEPLDKIEKDIKNTPKIQESLKDLIMKLQEENSDLKDKWQRALADYQNLERRTQVEILQRVSEKKKWSFTKFH